MRPESGVLAGITHSKAAGKGPMPIRRPIGPSSSSNIGMLSMVAVSLVGCTDVVEFQTYSFTITESLPDSCNDLTQVGVRHRALLILPPDRVA